MKFNNVFRDISLTFIFLSAASILGYVSRVILARNLSPSDYGLFYAIVGFYSFFGIFRSLGMAESLIHFIPKYVREKNMKKVKFSIKHVFYWQLFMGFVFSSMFYLFSNQIASNFFHIPEAASLIRVQAVTFFIIGFTELLSSVFRGLQKNFLASLYDPIRLGFMVVFSLVILKTGMFTVNNLLYLWLGGYVLLALFYAFTFYTDYGKILKVKSEKFSSVIREIKRYSIPVLLGVGAQILFSRTSTLFLTFFKGTTDVGFYEIAFPASQLIILAAAPVSFVLFPMVSKLFYDKNKSAVRDILQTIYNTGLFLLIPAVAILLIYPEIIITVLFSSKYVQAANALRVMTLGALFLTFGDINFSIISGFGEIKKRMRILYTVAAFNILASVLLIPSLGYLGAIISTAGSYFILWLLSSFVCYSLVPGSRISFRAMFKMILNLAVFLVVVFAMKNLLIMNTYLKALIVAVSSVIVYFLLGIFVFRVININHIKNLYDKVRQK